MANNGNGNGQVVVSGGSGSTTVQATATSTKINGGDGNDLIIGGGQVDDIRAGNGNDTIDGGAGNDIIFGNDGYDVAKIRDLSTLSIAQGQGGALIATSSDGVDTLKHVEAISDGTNTYIVGQNNGVYGLGSTAATTENGAVTFNAFAAAFDVEDDAFSIISATNSVAGASVSFTASGSLTYTPGALFDHLAVGATATDTFSYTARDAAGNSTTQTVTVTLTGTNDAPVISGGATSGAVGEDGTLSASGSLTATDVDNGDALSWSVQGGGDGAYGSLSINDSGSWTYALANGSSAVQALAAGQQASDSFTVKVSDGHGGIDTEVVNVTIAGANDAPTITGGATTGTVSEDDVLTATGTLSATDVDNGATLSWSVQGDPSGHYGSLAVDASGGWTYTLDNDSTAVQDLNNGDSVTDTFTLEVSDGSGGIDTQAITVTIGGENDAPEVVDVIGTRTLTFDGLNGPFTSYQGFNFSASGSFYYGSPNWYAVGDDVFNGWSGKVSTMTKGDGSDFSIDGLEIWNMSGVGTVQFIGLNNGSTIYSQNYSVTGSPTDTELNFANIDEFRIVVTQGAYSGNGVDNTGWWWVDNVSVVG